MTALVVIDPKSGRLSRWLGKQRTHGPLNFSINGASLPVTGDAQFKEWIEELRARPQNFFPEGSAA